MTHFAPSLGIWGRGGTISTGGSAHLSGSVYFPSSSGGVTTLMQDTFTEASNTGIALHTPDIDTNGSGWVQNAATVTVIGGGGYATLSANGTHCTINVGQDDFSAQLTGTPISTVGKFQLILAYQNLNNLYFCALVPATGQAELWQRVGGVFTNLASAATDHTGTNQFTMTGVKSGNDYSVSVNGTEVIAATTISTITPTSGLVGLRSNTTVAHQYEELLVTA